ncbi:dihydrolipoamide acetyltransferase family protein [Brevibacterium sp. CFH 10365]|uniref:dihydrolipoamide acetyltransferase family protein n=1 Tax=Brevibacterium sp. CFH 10365 TaxID=2585207 RepID=UPI0012664D8B|nr:dihydrolipoamide acetyltransferase family protein [Brevibacterium sp. CFH 10365]
MTDILMPRLSDTMEEGVISRWNVEVGDEVTKGDILGEIETDKATMDFEAYDSGVVSSLLVEEGSTVAIGERVAVLGDDSTDSGDAEDSGESDQSEKSEDGAEPDESEKSEDSGEPAAGDDSGGEESEAGDDEDRDESADSTGASEASGEEESSEAEAPSPESDESDEDGSGARISPLARKMADKHDIDTAEVEGTGPRGRIIRVDVEKAIFERDESGDDDQADRPASDQESSEDATVSLNANQRVTAKRLSDNVGVPTFRLTSKVDADALMAFRSEINERLATTGDKVSLTDLLTRACAVMLREHPEVNSSWNEDSIIRRGGVNVGIAVALDSGLIVPVIRDADRKSVSQIGRESRDLAERAKSGKLHPDEFSGGSFSISNLGMYGIDDFTAIINPPEAAILAVGAAVDEPVVRDGELTTRTVITMTMTVDHRVLNGAEAAVFLGDLKSLLEEPLRIVV